MHHQSFAEPYDRGIRAALRDYPVPSPQAAASAAVSEEERRKLASLGYVASSAAPVVELEARGFN